MVAWPTPQDYNEAVQNPKFAFADPELQDGRPELTPLGLPRAITGNFASVYRLQCPQRTWAVKCFLRRFHDHERRYAAISEHLTQARLPYTVGFTFLRDGIRVRGQWYPILKMEWVQGELLSSFVGRHLEDREALLALARQWVGMVRALQQASIAHGDLQHGNVLVVDGQLRLIDYDGMFVPALWGEGSHEVGHPNYQHPLRTGSDFGPYLDNFSAWVIYVSLIALAADPGLWKQFGGGDESLLFRREDFEEPEPSDVFHALERHRDQQIRSAIALFKPLLYLGPQDVPPLDDHIRQIAPPDHSGTKLAQSGASWTYDHTKHGSACPPEQVASPPVDDPDVTIEWVWDYVRSNSTEAVSFKNSLLPERLVLSASVAIMVAFEVWLPGRPVDIEWLELAILVAFNVFGFNVWLSRLSDPEATFVEFVVASLLVLVLLVLINLALWTYRYYSDPSKRELAALRARLRATNKMLSATEHTIAVANREKAECLKRKAAEEAMLDKERKAVAAREMAEIDACQAHLQSALASINALRRTLSQQEADALRKIQNDVRAKVASLNAQIATLTQAEATELARTLREHQQQYLAAYLRQFTLESASIPGVGPGFKARLQRNGFHTAADIDIQQLQRVQGIGPTHAQSLCNWRKSLEMRARSTMPLALSQSEEAAIRAKFESQRRTLEAERDRERMRQREEEEKILAEYRSLFRRLNEEESEAKAKTHAAICSIRTHYSQEYRRIQEALSVLSVNTASTLARIDSRIAGAQKKCRDLYSNRRNLERRLKAYEGIRFSRYVKLVMFGSNVT